MTTNDDWGGRRFGDLTPREQRDAARKAFRQLQQEFEEHADEISAALDINTNYHNTIGD
jgi:hypothetical protein